MSGFSVSIEKSVEAVTTLASNAECSMDMLRNNLDALVQELDQGEYAALALIAETVSKGCDKTAIPSDDLRAALLDLCDRLVQAAKSDEPFSFDGADPNLMSLIFPPDDTTTSETSDSSANGLSVEDDGNQLELTNDSSFSTDGQMVICPCNDDLLMDQFITEASELIENAQNLLLKLEKRPSDTESLNELFRSIHSVKGAAGVCELDSLIDVAHVAENVLDRVRDGKLILAESVFHVILRSVDFVALQLQSLKEAFRNKRPLQYPSPPRILMECLEVVDDRGEASSYQLAQLDSRLGKDASSDSQQAIVTNAGDSLRVDGRKLELLVDLIGELVITEGFVQRELVDRATSSASTAGIRLKKVVRDIQQLSLSLKMVPIGSLLQKMNRLVRELSAKLDKPAQVVIRGADTEIDKTLLESLTDPLVHLIRNSLDHGIENSVQKRIAAGKPEVATIEVAAEHRSGNVHISITDDGNGLDRERIRQRALEQGLITKDARLTDHEIDSLIFTPGFSTAQKVSEISGRGVGMDVVRSNVEALRGNILLQSQPGKGTIVRLEFPLTLSIIDGTVAKVGDRWFILPTVAVLEQFQLDQLSFQSNHAGNFILFRDRLIQVCFLGDVVGAEHKPCVNRGQVCMVVEAFGQRHGLVVDEILGQQSIVIKPLGPVLRPLSLFAGCAQLSGGEIAFVLDTNAVCRKVSSGVHNFETLEQLQ